MLHALRAMMLVLASVFTRAAPGQQFNWQPAITAQGGVAGLVSAAIIHDDGRGPAVFVAGEFTVAGGAPARNIARWDGIAWQPLGDGLSGPVNALAVYQGRLVAGGQFQCAGGVSASGIAAWDGQSWSSLGPGVDGGSVAALCVYNGSLIAGGAFTSAGASPVGRIAKWDGSVWSGLGASPNNGIDGIYPYVWSLAVYRDDLIVAGSFTSAGAAPASRIAKWNGLAWSPLAEGAGDEVFALAVDGPDLLAGGSFLIAGGVNAPRIARWNGSAWSAFAAAPGQSPGFSNGAVRAITVFGGAIYAAGSFNASGVQFTRGIARWVGGAWLPLSGGVEGPVNALAEWNSELIVAGSFLSAGNQSANNLARWDGEAWLPTTSGLPGRVRALAADGTRLIAAGAFASGGTAPIRRVAAWDGSAWTSLGGGANGDVNCLTRGEPGLVAGGQFSEIGGVAASSIAVWGGSVWRPLGSGIAGIVSCVASAGPTVYAGGSFATAGGSAAMNVARWNGVAWSAMGSGLSGPVSALLALPSGDVVAGGYFFFSGSSQVGFIARWDGSRWAPLGAGMNGPVTSLTLFENSLIASGGFTASGTMPLRYLARFDGQSWSGLGGGLDAGAAALTVFDGKLFAAGRFSLAGSTGARWIAQWDGAGWSALGAGLRDGSPFASGPAAMTTLGSALIVGGDFTLAGDIVSPFIATWGRSPFADPQSIAGGNSPSSVAVANFNADPLGRRSLAVANAASNNVTILLNTGIPGSTATFTAPSPAFTFPVGTEPRSIVTADFDGDGTPDLAVANAGSDTVTILMGQGNGSFSAGQTVATAARPVWLSVSDLNNDGRPDLVVACQNSGTTQVLRNTGGGQFTVVANLQHNGSSGRPTSTGSGDLDGDKQDDIVVTDGGTGVVAAFQNLGNFSFGPPQLFSAADACAAPDPRSVQLTDIDGDGLLDVVTANRGNNSVSVLLNLGVSADGAGSWNGLGIPTLLPVGGLPTGVTTGDFYGDGRMDLVSANAANSPDGSISVLRNTSAPGSVSFTREIRQTVPPDAGFITTADINGDNRPDLVLANSVLAGQDEPLIGSAPRSTGQKSRSGDAPAGNATTLLNATTAPLRSPCPGDVNGDGVVDSQDLMFVLSNYGRTGPALPGDLNTDGVVDFFDLNRLLAAYGTGC